jgi:hypothetical protein
MQLPEAASNITSSVTEGTLATGVYVGEGVDDQSPVFPQFVPVNLK